MDAIITTELQLKSLMLDCMIELMRDAEGSAEMLSGAEMICEKLLDRLVK